MDFIRFALPFFLSPPKTRGRELCEPLLQWLEHHSPGIAPVLVSSWQCGNTGVSPSGGWAGDTLLLVASPYLALQHSVRPLPAKQHFQLAGERRGLCSRFSSSTAGINLTDCSGCSHISLCKGNVQHPAQECCRIKPPALPGCFCLVTFYQSTFCCEHRVLTLQGPCKDSNKMWDVWMLWSFTSMMLISTITVKGFCKRGETVNDYRDQEAMH